ncbi:MAG: hypothetical protein RJA70_3375 [Pseudomonadota bacterium]|jgi:hypothetical protein
MKLLVFLLVASTAFAGLSACSKKDDPKKEEAPSDDDTATPSRPDDTKPTRQDDSDPSGACSDCKPSEVCVAAKCEPPGTPALTTKVGDKPGQVGIVEGNESEGEGPMSFAVRSDGKIAVLDQVNKRLQLFNAGAVEKIIPLDSAFYQDVVFLDNETVVLMDKAKAQELVVMNLEGDVKRRIKLSGPGVNEPAEAGRMYVRPDGVWVMFNQSIHFLDADGREADRTMLPGLVTCNGKHLLSTETLKNQLNLLRRSRSGPLNPETLTHEFDLPIHTLWVDSDCEGRVFVVTANFDRPKTDGRARLTVFDSALKFVRDVEIKYPSASLDAGFLKEFHLTPAGELYQYAFGDDGVLFQRY